jgi:predicted phosphodiesterase
MRYLVFGDVHGNLPALDTVLTAGRARGVEAYLFVGDLVGYGSEPVECISRLAELHQRGTLAWVAGNHELALRGEVPLEGYSDEALTTLEWTRSVLAGDPAAKDFLNAAQVAVQVNDGIWLTHDSLAEPGGAGYHRWPQKAKSELACLRWHGGRVAFYGHTHSMRAELASAETDLVLAPMDAHEGEGLDPHPVRLGATGLGWIGTGSVGFPTNPERRAEFLILDDTTWQLEKYAVVYPREEARAKVRSALTAPCGAEIADRIARWL